MNRNKKIFDNTGVSIVVGYILMLGIATMLSVTLIWASTDHLEQQNLETTETQAEVVLNTVAAEIEEVDKVVSMTGGSNIDLSVTSEVPDRIGAYDYSLKLYEADDDINELDSHTAYDSTSGDTYILVLEVQSQELDVTKATDVILRNIDSVDTGSISTGSGLMIHYDQEELSIE